MPVQAQADDVAIRRASAIRGTGNTNGVAEYQIVIAVKSVSTESASQNTTNPHATVAGVITDGVGPGGGGLQAMIVVVTDVSS
jgi:hypothetical protein